MNEFQDSKTFILMQLTNAFRYSLEKRLNEIGLHSGQVFILISLWQTDGQSQIDLVRNLKVTAPTVNKMIKSLSAGGFVESRRCGTDGRLTRIFLTDKGSDCQSSVAERWSETEEQFLAVLTDTEKLILLQLFGKMKENLSGVNRAAAT